MLSAGPGLERRRKAKVLGLGCVRLFMTTWTIARQAALSMGFSREEHWSGLPFPLPGDFPNPGMTPTCPSPALAGGFFIMEPPVKP